MERLHLNPASTERPRRLIYEEKRLLRGNPIGGIRPAAPRAARHGVRSVSVLTRPLSPPSTQLRPSDCRKAIASDRPPSRYRCSVTPCPLDSSGSSESGKT